MSAPMEHPIWSEDASPARAALRSRFVWACIGWIGGAIYGVVVEAFCR